MPTPSQPVPDPAPATGASLSSAPTEELVRRLREHSSRSTRYTLEGELARGGMGAILKIWDEDLRRHLAMKVILDRTEAPASSAGTPHAHTKQVARFLEEAQVTGQLDHPGIVPVHELGLDSEGRVYFTMKFVKGRDLKQVFDLVFAGHEGWNETRALGVILKACEAMGYAHAKGVVHRDLKPANVMVGNFGEVYVMDWGIARVLGRKDSHDIRIAPEFTTSLHSVQTERREEREEFADSPIVTMDGDVMGTPAYMAPEQARGEVEKLGPRSDVYSVGCMLYHLLARRMPYVPPGARVTNRTVLGMVLQGPPVPLGSLRKNVPAELVAICERAMAREMEARYADTLEFAEDLRAYLEHRVVGAYETGAWAEGRKWVQRNRPLAVALAGAILLLVAGLTASLVFKKRADSSAAEATKKANDVLSLSAVQDLVELERRADALWPAFPEHLADYDAWLADARALIEGRPADPARGQKKRPSLQEHETNLAQLRTRAKPPLPGASEPRTYEFEDGEDRWWEVQLSKLVADLHAFTDEQAGGLYSAGTSAEHGWGITKRRASAAAIEQRSKTGEEARQRWAQAIESVAKNPAYAGLVLAPQAGLLPIGVDPRSGLCEFADVQTGEPPRRAADGNLVLEPEMSLVFVLIPGGTFTMGAQRDDPSLPNYDRAAEGHETPCEVTLDAYFLSKFEMTQGQWERFTGGNPSLYGSQTYPSSWNRAGKKWTALHPVEQVPWIECDRVMSRLGLALPTEAQWERAARAGTSSPYSFGDDKAGLAAAGNVADQYARQHDGGGWASHEAWDDGNTAHAEVGSYAPNSFGLHDVHGNLWEWCRDLYGTKPSFHAGDGERQGAETANRTARGGSYGHAASYARSASRYQYAPGIQFAMLGLRPARALVAR